MQNGSLRGPREDALPNAILEDTGRTALHDAACTGDEKTLRVLLGGGADRNAKDLKHGNTPLHEAAWRGFSRCVKALCTLPQPKITKDSKAKLPDTRGALHSALLGTRNAGGFSALHLAAQNGHNQSCREILLAGADPDVQNNYGDTPLHTACRYGHAGATRILISAKCDPNRTNLNGDTSLHIACAMGRRKLTRILLEAGSNANIKNAQNETPRDISLRKNLAEIVEILDSPVTIKPIKDRDRSSSNSKSADRTDGVRPNSKGEPTTTPANWSPYGCHYFPDPRSFPSPKLETLPKEPLGKGEQYYLDLAGNIRKGPIGVGNTCYCGPFFRHIEERISRNRKSIRKYVQKTTERLDNKVQALALRTDDQIEQLTKSMLADKIRCEGRRLHLEEWLRRGEPGRVTVGHNAKSKKNFENTNTLTRCRSLELLDDDNMLDKKMHNSRSFDLLDETDVIIHHDATPSENRCPSSELKISRNSDRSRSSGACGSTEHYSVSRRLEELLAKTNEILEMERSVRLRNKDAIVSLSQEKGKKKSKKSSEKIKLSPALRHSMYNEDIIDQLKQTSLEEGKSLGDAEFIAHEMEKITSSLLMSKISDEKSAEQPPITPEITKEYVSQKEFERKSDQEHERSSILSESSHKNNSSTGSGYVHEFQNLRVKTNKPTSLDTSNKSLSSIDKPVDICAYDTDYHDIEQINAEEKFKKLISALRKDYHAARNTIEAEIARETSNQSYDNKNGENEIIVYSTDQVDLENMQPMLNGFYHNSTFDDLPNSSSNTLKSEQHQQNFESPYGEPDENIELSEMANIQEINELKSRILNGSHWRSQVLRKSQQQQDQSQDDSGMHGINGIMKKFEIKNSEIKTLKSPTSGALRRSKVQELVAKIQGDPHEPNHDENSESSEDEEETPRTHIRHQNVSYSPVTTEAQLHLPNVTQQQSTLYYYDDFDQTPQFQSQIHYNPNINISMQQQSNQMFDTRKLIPKDAYFHDLPNKNRVQSIVDKNPEKQMINFTDQFNNSNSLMARTRNPLPYVQGYDIPLPNNAYLNKPYPDIINNQTHQTHAIITNQPSPNNVRYNPCSEKLLSSRKFAFSNMVDSELNSIHSKQYLQQISPSSQLQHVISITPEQAQLERDMNNDSGYSTKICGSSHGPSPSLSGHTDYGSNGNNAVSHNMVQTTSNTDPNGVTYFIPNVGASSLV